MEGGFRTTTPKIQFSFVAAAAAANATISFVDPTPCLPLETSISATMTSDDNKCTQCSADIGWKWYKFWEPGVYHCSACETKLCKSCYNNRPLLVPNSEEAKKKQDLNQAYQELYCQSCFEKKSTIDFSTKYTKVPDDEGKMKQAKVLYVFVHGGGASRALFAAHADELFKRFGHASILLDLPGHASLVDMPLSVDSAVRHVGSVMKECGIVKKDDRTKNQKVVYVGASLGGYLGFPIIEKYQSMLDAAMIFDCGQNVGPGCSYIARMGIVLLSYMAKNKSNADLLNLMLGVTKKSPADYKLIDTCFGAGMFFDQGEEQVVAMHAVAPADHLPNIKLPILFMNGSKDHRDSEQKWLELCGARDKSELKVYEGGDHFFTHDARFVDDMLTRLDAFAVKA